MRYLPECVLGALLLGALAPLGGTRAALADPPPPRAEAEERWIGLRVKDPDLRLRAVHDTKGPLNEVADAIPFLVIALDDESPPVQAAARERLRALADEAVTPILDALQAARPGRKAGAFGALSAMGTTVTPLELAVAAGGMAPVNPPDRREAALMLALPAATPTGGARSKRSASLRLASLLLRDTDAQVRRTAAAALALVGLQHARATDAARQEPAIRRGLRLTLSQGQRERVSELMAQGGADVAVAAAGLASRFEDASEPVLAGLIKMLDKEDRRDAAAFALADLGEAALPAVPALSKHASLATWRALLRLEQMDLVFAALRATNKSEQRLAASALLAHGIISQEAVEVFLPEIQEALDDGKPHDVKPWLRRMLEWGADTAAGRAMEKIQAFVERKDTDARAQDLAAAAAFAIDGKGPAWALPRVTALLAQGDPVAPDRADPEVELAIATALRGHLRNASASGPVPRALTARRLSLQTLSGEVVMGRLAVFVGRSQEPGPYLEMLVSGLEGPGPVLAQDGPPTLKDLAQHGAAADGTVLTRWVALELALESVGTLPDTHRGVVERLTQARDPWLRHLAARVLRRRWPG